MSKRIYYVLKARCGERREGWVFPSKRAKSAHLTTMAKGFREARPRQGFPKILSCIVGCTTALGF